MSAPAVGTSVNAFAVNFNQLIHSSDSTDNYVFSPLSLVSALAMCYAGSGNETQRQFEKLLSISGDDFHANYAQYMLSLREATTGPIALKIANRLYTQDGFSVKQKFNALLQSRYGGTMGTFNAGDADGSSKAINGFVKETTNGMIKDLVPAMLIKPDLMLIIINAVYFKGEWETKFDPDRTRTLPFYTTPTSTVKVRMMTARGIKAFYTHDDVLKAQLVEISYKGSGFVFTAIVPDELDGLEHIVSSLTPARLSEAFSLMGQRKLDLLMPKFDIEYTVTGAEKMLRRLGLVDAFSSAADFSGISATEKLIISNVIHKAKIIVNEEGAEAAAATANMMSRCATTKHEDSIVVNMNRPFIYMIRELGNSSILFMGRVMKP